MFPPVCASPTGLRFRQSSGRTAQSHRKKSPRGVSNDRNHLIAKGRELQSSCQPSRRQRNGRELDCAPETRARHKNEATIGCPESALLRMPGGRSLASRQVSRPEPDKVVARAGPKASKDNAEFLRG